MSPRLRFLADEDFRGKIVRALKRRLPEVDLLRVQDVELPGAADPVVLEWAARDNRIVLSHDADTMTGYAYERVSAELRMPGLCIVPQSLPIARAIDELLIAIECSRPEDWENQVRYIPL